MTFAIRDRVMGMDAESGLPIPIPRAPVYARPTATPLKITLDARATWVELQNPQPTDVSDENGYFLLTLYNGNECDPNTNTWQLYLPDATVWSGPSPASYGPWRIDQLKNSQGWGLVQGTMPITIVTGPQGIGGSINDLIFPGYNGNGADSIATTFNDDGSIDTVYQVDNLSIHTTFPGDGSIKEVYTGAISHTKATTFPSTKQILEAVT